MKLSQSIGTMRNWKSKADRYGAAKCARGEGSSFARILNLLKEPQVQTLTPHGVASAARRQGTRKWAGRMNFESNMCIAHVTFAFPE